MNNNFDIHRLDTMRKTILLLAYSVSPIRGSEYSVGWNYIKEMSQDHNLIVLYGLAGDHMGDVDEVDLSPICRSLPNVQWIAVRPNWLANLLNTPNRNGFFVYSFYLAYKVWHRQVYQVAKSLVQNQPIDLIHYLCPIGYREPGYLWKINKPYIWGPVGGVQNRSVRLALEKSTIAGVKIALRNVVNTLQFRFSPRVRAAFSRADIVLASTSKTQQLILDVQYTSAILLAENAITDQMLANQRLVVRAQDTHLNIIWVGSIDERKSLDILLHALSQIQSSQWHLSVIGAGVLQAQCAELATQLGISANITWVGKVTREQVQMYYGKAHIHAITSMMEANTTVIWEAMSFGVPTISLDHCGMHDVICDKCGVRVPIDGTLQSVVDGFAQQLSRLIAQPALIEQLSAGVLECTKQYSWTQRRVLLDKHYVAATKHWLAHQGGD
jgi:glycosyltransferase involved in cell wall biosynthesis